VKNYSKKVNAEMKSQQKMLQEMQDELFRNMTAEQKIKLASDFYQFARGLGGQDTLWIKKNYLLRAKRAERFCVAGS